MCLYVSVIAHHFICAAAAVAIAGILAHTEEAKQKDTSNSNFIFEKEKKDAANEMCVSLSFRFVYQLE